MNPIHAYLVGLTITATLSAATVVYLSRYLVPILTDICGSETRAAFWSAFSNVTIVLTPLLCALHRRPTGDADAFLVLTGQLEWALLGLIGAVLVLGIVISLFILCTPLVERSQAQAPRTPRAVRLRPNPPAG
ncbi:MAG: hypothetical protein ACYTG2_15535 [Planctomycetota bacterium]|jgi:hypothetical protein